MRNIKLYSTITYILETKSSEYRLAGVIAYRLHAHTSHEKYKIILNNNKEASEQDKLFQIKKTKQCRKTQKEKIHSPMYICMYMMIRSAFVSFFKFLSRSANDLVQKFCFYEIMRHLQSVGIHLVGN